MDILYNSYIITQNRYGSVNHFPRMHIRGASDDRSAFELALLQMEFFLGTPSNEGWPMKVYLDSIQRFKGREKEFLDLRRMATQKGCSLDVHPLDVEKRVPVLKSGCLLI